MTKIYAISLRSSLDRRAAFEAQCRAHALDVTFFDAIDGRSGLPREYEGLVDRPASIKRVGKVMTDAEFSCSLSHALLCKQIAEDDSSDGAVVFEDDAVFSSDFVELLNDDALRRSREDLVLLYHSNAQVLRNFAKPVYSKYRLRSPIKTPFGAVAYYISRHGAQQIYKRSMPISNVADWGIDLSLLKAKCIDPVIVDHPEETGQQSTIGERMNSAKRSLNEKLRDPLYRYYMYRKFRAEKIS